MKGKVLTEHTCQVGRIPEKQSHLCCLSLRGEWDAKGEHTVSGDLTENANHIMRGAVNTSL